MSIDQCRLCKIVLTPNQNRAIHDSVLMESETFEWLPGLGAFIEGYSLIVSKFHYPNTGSLTEAHIKELEHFTNRVKNVIQTIYNCKTILFEHGSTNSKKKAGCCIEHQHLHILPYNLTTIPNHLVKIFPIPEPISNYHDLKPFNDSNMPYIYYETSIGKRYVFRVPMYLPSQFIRQVLAVECGKLSCWEWGANPFYENSAILVSKVKEYLRINPVHY